MSDICSLQGNCEKKLYIQALAYVLNFDSQPPKVKKEYLLTQMADIGLPEAELKNIKTKCSESVLIKELKQISDIHIKRYILREMILLAMADHEIADKEIESLHKIGKEIGIKEEKLNDFFIWAAQGVEWQLQGVRLVEEDL